MSLLNGIYDAMNAQQNSAVSQSGLLSNAYQNGAIYNSVGGAGGTMAANVYKNYDMQALARMDGDIVHNPNDIASMAMELSALVVLWRAKFGDTWLPTNTPLPPTEDYNFWKYAAQRLYANKKLEVVNFYFRIKEGA